MNIQGHARVLLYAKKNIKKGDINNYVMFIKKNDKRSLNKLLDYCIKNAIYPSFISLSDQEKIGKDGFFSNNYWNYSFRHKK